MKPVKNLKWYENSKVTCVCGNTFTVGSTKPEIQVEICNLCHPFFTGEMKFVDTQGRVEKFKKQQQQAQAFQTKIKAKKKKTAKKKEQPQTLREMLTAEKKKITSAKKKAAKTN